MVKYNDMRIPRKQIKLALEYINKIESYRYIHFRELYTYIDYTNFHICTTVNFKKYKTGSIVDTWNSIKSLDLVYYHKSQSGSEYAITKNGDVYRLSNHWGAVKSCKWMLEGKGNLIRSEFVYGKWEIGMANLLEFEIFRWKEDRNVDILVNPKWIEDIKTLNPLKDILQSLIKDSDFKLKSNKDKHLIGSTFGMIKTLIKNI